MSEAQANGTNDPGGVRSAHPPIVVIGASAGGIKALQTLFENTPTDCGAAFIVVVHLDPEHRSELPQIISMRTRMPVVQVQDREKLVADHVYVIAPDRRLQIVDHEVSSSEFEEPRGQRAPIDLLFRSVAERLGDGVAIILSGAGSDGALGVRAVKESGGIIFVQDPAEAEYSSMPRSAIATGVVDVVAPVRELAARLVTVLSLKRKTGSLLDRAEQDDDLLRRIFSHLRTRTGHDFSRYKRSTVMRRIVRRMQVTHTGDLQGYYHILRENLDEAQALMSDLLISVTTFFRDRESFEQLQRSVLPRLFKDDAESIRVWVAGCATGEEAYSIAILLLEESAKHELRPTLQVFGSDIDARALVTAREGRYPTAIETDVSEERLRRFFTRESQSDTYRVRQELRDIVLFAAHDMAKDPPFSHVDLVTCRNVLIYLERELQEQICTTFHYALNPQGYLMLGGSESAEQPFGLFRVIDRSARLFQSTASSDKGRLLTSLPGPARSRERIVHSARSLSSTVVLSEASTHRRVLEAVAPPSILVDEHHRVSHMSDSAGRYLQPSGGTLSGDVVDLVRQELRFELRSALHRVFEQNVSTVSLPLLVRFNGDRHRVHLHVKAPVEREEPRTAIVMFIEGEAVADDFAVGDQEASNEIVHRLTQELELTQARLHAVRQESDTANEELRASNEELQSLNEEYRSTSEELETSKEELQSINEELQTVNNELKLKLEKVSQSHSDMQNLMAATDFGTLFLDSTLCIKRFTDRVTELFRLTQADVGRPITDFAHQLEYDDFTRDIRAVLSDLAPVRREVRSQRDCWYDVRMRPYRTVDDRIDGVVITFVDITERRRTEDALRDSEHQLRQQKRLVEMSREPIYIWDFDGGIIDWNRGCEELYGYSRQEAVGRRKEHLLNTAVPGSSLEEMNEHLIAHGHWFGELSQRAKDGRMLIVEARLDLENVDGRRLVLESTRDITQRKTLQESQQLLLGELTHRVKNTLAVVQSIAHQTEITSRSPAEFVERFTGRLAALANAHALLVQSEWQGADLRALTRVQLRPYASGNAKRLQIEGPAILLPSELATPFALVLHELATNAAKYGALAEQAGTVSVRWDVSKNNGQRDLRLVWHERGGPSPAKAPPAGLGSDLIDHAIPGARVQRELHEDGLVCTIELSLLE